MNTTYLFATLSTGFLCTTPLLAQQAGPADWLDCGVRFTSLEERSSLFGIPEDPELLTYITPVMNGDGPVQLYRREYSVGDDGEIVITEQPIGFFFPDFIADDPASSLLNYSINLDDTYQFLEDEICGEPVLCLRPECLQGEFIFQGSAYSGEFVSLDGQVSYVIGRIENVSFEPADPTQDPGEVASVFVPDFLANDPPLLQDVRDVSNWAVPRQLAEEGRIMISVERVDSILTLFYSDDVPLLPASYLSNREQRRWCEMEYWLCRDLARHKFQKARDVCEEQWRTVRGIVWGGSAFITCTAAGTAGGALIGGTCGTPALIPGIAAGTATGAVIGRYIGSCIGVATGTVCCVDEWMNGTDRCIERAFDDFADELKVCIIERSWCYKMQDADFGISP